MYSPAPRPARGASSFRPGSAHTRPGRVGAECERTHVGDNHYAMPHAELMAKMAEEAYAYVKTGDCAAYSTVVLQCGVSYLADAIALHRSLHD